MRRTYFSAETYFYVSWWLSRPAESRQLLSHSDGEPTRTL